MLTHHSTQKISFQYGDHTVTLETGMLAQQATSAVLVSIADTVILVTLVAMQQPSANTDFLPLSVHYQERNYAVGRIPGGYFKREGRPSEREILIARLIDRSLRPVFLKHFYHEVQIIATVLSCNPEIPNDIPAMLGAAAALALSGLPCQGLLAAARVAYVKEQYVLNPSQSQLVHSGLDLVVAGTGSAVLMVESEANELSIDVMSGAIAFGHQQMQVAIQAISDLAKANDTASSVWNWRSEQLLDPAVVQKFNDQVEAPLSAAIFKVTEKSIRKAQRYALYQRIMTQWLKEMPEITTKQVDMMFAHLEAKLIRNRTLAGQPRLDGRDTRTVRPISIQTRLLPRAHGSALFTRGETQALVVATLGTDRDTQLIDGLEGDRRESFMLHYNFQPYCVGEVGQVGSPKRREIGHGNLARRALRAVLPSEDVFPYVLRIVSEIMSSNGSSSMATVCGASLALMDAGVPLRKPVAGIAMGLIKEGTRFAILSDILGDEDHLGDMDFKVAGTQDGITALQMDIKIDGITREIMEAALKQAIEGLHHILSQMNAALETARVEVSPYAPRIVSLQISPDKIRDVIGKGGATIRSITEETGTLIDISDSGLIRISTSDEAACKRAVERIQQITAEAEIGAVYTGPVVKLIESGAFVSILPGQDGFVHVSEVMASGRVMRISDVLQEGQIVKVKVLDIDRHKNRVRLTMKGIELIEDVSSIV